VDYQITDVLQIHEIGVRKEIIDLKIRMTEPHNSTSKKAKQTIGFIKLKEKLFFSTHLLLNKSSANPDFFLDSMSKAPVTLL
jgi:hypothetical protein